MKRFKKVSFWNIPAARILLFLLLIHFFLSFSKCSLSVIKYIYTNKSLLYLYYNSQISKFQDKRCSYKRIKKEARIDFFFSVLYIIVFPASTGFCTMSGAFLLKIPVPACGLPCDRPPTQFPVHSAQPPPASQSQRL